MQQTLVRLLYVLGSGRSGTTLLSRVLDQVDDVFSAGEVRQIWHRNIANRRHCGCGALFRECPVWHQVFTQAFGGFDLITDDFAAHRPARDRWVCYIYLVGRRCSSVS